MHVSKVNTPDVEGWAKKQLRVLPWLRRCCFTRRQMDEDESSFTYEDV